MSSAPERSRSVSPAEGAADRIRAGILAGDFAPGQRLIESELCERYGCSRGAVRAALVDLEHEGLVERIANRGARVRAVGVEEAVAITEVRMVLEGLCAAKAAERVTEVQVAELRDIGRRMREAVAHGEVVVYSGLNTLLHDRLREIGRQPVASDLLANLLARNVRRQFKLALRPGRPQVSLPQHLAIIDAICARDPAAADRAAREHVADVIVAMREMDG
ncbi:GntR family transcriptional regulator [Streptomyces sp. NPDC052052]|uniref:GntR family transcriptional regulator n=1 Tax=Streptomyces sp. NPDC052052 TaxID=3154756 RepID=UPI00341E3D33